MKLAAIPNQAETALLGAFFLLANLGNALYAAQGVQPSAGYLLLWYAGFGLAVALWMHADSRRLAIREEIDSGWFVYIAWPILLPYHASKTRGKRGAVTLLGLIGLYVVTYLISLLVYLFFRQAAVPR